MTLSKAVTVQNWKEDRGEGVMDGQAGTTYPVYPGTLVFLVFLGVPGGLPHGALRFGGLGPDALVQRCGAAVGIFGPGEVLWLVTRRKGTRCLASAQQIPVQPALGRGW